MTKKYLQRQTLSNVVEFCNRNDSEVILTFPFSIPNTLDEFPKFLKEPLSVISQSFLSLRTDLFTTKDKFSSTQRGRLEQTLLSFTSRNNISSLSFGDRFLLPRYKTGSA